MEMHPTPEQGEVPTLSFVSAFKIQGAAGRAVLTKTGVAFFNTLMIADGEPFDAKIFREATGYDDQNLASNLTSMSSTINKVLGAEVIKRERNHIRQPFMFRMGAVALHELRPQEYWPAIPENLRGLLDRLEFEPLSDAGSITPILITRPEPAPVVSKAPTSRPAPGPIPKPKPKPAKAPVVKPAAPVPKKTEARRAWTGDDDQKIVLDENLSAEDDWRKRAACKDEDPELFFPVGTSGAALWQIAEAKTVCRRCPVASKCLSWALEVGEDNGVFGGMSEDERREMKRRHAQARVKTL